MHAFKIENHVVDKNVWLWIQKMIISKESLALPTAPELHVRLVPNDEMARIALTIYSNLSTFFIYSSILDNEGQELYHSKPCSVDVLLYQMDVRGTPSRSFITSPAPRAKFQPGAPESGVTKFRRRLVQCLPSVIARSARHIEEIGPARCSQCA
jgi:hypothetical protein